MPGPDGPVARVPHGVRGGRRRPAALHGDHDVMHQRTGDRAWLDLAKRMAKGTAILFAVGAVSGTVLSFELGLLWPSFMGSSGDRRPALRPRGLRLLHEAIFLGIYLYGRDRIPAKLHLFAGVMVAISGLLSAFFVTLVNACMNLPAGSPWSTAAPPTSTRWRRWSAPRGRTRRSTRSSPATRRPPSRSPASTRWCSSATPDPRSSARRSPSRWRSPASPRCSSPSPGTTPRTAWPSSSRPSSPRPRLTSTPSATAPILIGGIPDEDTREVKGAIRIPHALSLLATNDPSGEVKGLEEFPREDWPPVLRTHLASTRWSDPARRWGSWPSSRPCSRGAGGGSPISAGSSAPWWPRGRWASSRWRPGGASPSSAASRGSSTAPCAPGTRSLPFPPRGPVLDLHAPLRLPRGDRGLPPLQAAPRRAGGAHR